MEILHIEQYHEYNAPKNGVLCNLANIKYKTLSIEQCQQYAYHRDTRLVPSVFNAEKYYIDSYYTERTLVDLLTTAATEIGGRLMQLVKSIITILIHSRWLQYT